MPFNVDLYLDNLRKRNGTYKSSVIDNGDNSIIQHGQNVAYQALNNNINYNSNSYNYNSNSYNNNSSSILNQQGGIVQQPVQEENKPREINNPLDFFKSFWDGFLDTTGSVMEGGLNFFDDLFDFTINTAAEIGGLFGADKSWKNDVVDFDWQALAVDKTLSLFNPYLYNGEWFTDWSTESSRQHLNEFHNNNLVNYVSGDANDFMKGVWESIGYMLPSVAAGMVGGQAASLAVMGVGSFAGTSNDVYRETGNYGASLLSGAISAAIETGSELLVGPALSKVGLGVNKVMGVVGKGASEAGESFIKTMVKTMIEEGTEEAVSAILNPLVQAPYKGEEAFKNDKGEIVYFDKDFWLGGNESVASQALAGAVSSAIMGGAHRVKLNSQLSSNGVEIAGLLEDIRTQTNELKNLDPNSEEYSKKAEQITLDTARISSLYDQLSKSGKTKQIRNVQQLLTDPLSFIKAMSLDQKEGEDFDFKKANENIDNLVKQRINEMKDPNKLATRNLFDELQEKYGTDYTLEFSDDIDENTQGDIDLDKKVIKLSNKYAEKYGATLAHEYLGHAINEYMSPEQRQSIYNEITKSKWFKEHEEQLRKAYGDLLKETDGETPHQFAEEVTNKYIESIFSRMNNLQAVSAIGDISLRNNLFNRFKALFNKNNNLNILKNDKILQEFMKTSDKFIEYTSPESKRIVDKLLDGDKLSKREMKEYEKNSDFFDMYVKLRKENIEKMANDLKEDIEKDDTKKDDEKIKKSKDIEPKKNDILDKLGKDKKIERLRNEIYKLKQKYNGYGYYTKAQVEDFVSDVKKVIRLLLEDDENIGITIDGKAVKGKVHFIGQGIDGIRADAIFEKIKNLSKGIELRNNPNLIQDFSNELVTKIIENTEVTYEAEYVGKRTIPLSNFVSSTGFNEITGNIFNFINDLLTNNAMDDSKVTYLERALERIKEELVNEKGELKERARALIELDREETRIRKAFNFNQKGNKVGVNVADHFEKAFLLIFDGLKGRLVSSKKLAVIESREIKQTEEDVRKMTDDFDLSGNTEEEVNRKKGKLAGIRANIRKYIRAEVGSVDETNALNKIPDQYKDKAIEYKKTFEGNNYEDVKNIRGRLREYKEKFYNEENFKKLNLPYDEDIAAYIDSIIDESRTHENLSTNEMDMFTKILKNLRHIQQVSHQVEIDKKLTKIRDLGGIAGARIEGLKAIGAKLYGSETMRSKIKRGFHYLMQIGLSPDKVIQYFDGGMENGILHKLITEKIVEGERNGNEMIREIVDFKDKNFTKNDLKKMANEVEIKVQVDDKTTKTYKMDVGTALEIYTELQRDWAMEHYKTTKSMEYNYNKTTYKIDYHEDIREAIEDALGKEYTERMSKNLLDIFKITRKYKIQTDEAIYGFTNVLSADEAYYYIRTTESSRGGDVGGNLYQQQRNLVRGFGFNKRTISARGILSVQNAMDTISQYITNMYRYVSYANALDSTNRYLNFNMGTADSPKYVHDMYTKQVDSNFMKYLNDYFLNIQGISNGGHDAISRGLSFVRSNFGKATLFFNPQVAAKQVSSYPMFLVYVSAKNWIKGLASASLHPRNARRAMIKASSMAFQRYYGNDVQAAEVLATDGSKKNAVIRVIDKTTGGLITVMDKYTCKAGYQACLLESNGDESKAMELFEQALRESQPSTIKSNSSALRRGAVGGELGRMISMFGSQTQQNASLVYGVIHNYIASKRLFKISQSNSEQLQKMGYTIDEVTSMYNSATKKMRRAFTALTMQATLYTLIGMAFKHLMGKDDDDENMAVTFALGMFDSTVGSMSPFIQQINNIFLNGYDFNLNSINAINDFIDSIKEGGSLIGDLANGEDFSISKLYSFISGVSQFFGLPVKNATKYTNWIISWFNPEVALQMNNVLYGVSSTNSSRNLNEMIEKGDDNKAKAELSYLMSQYKTGDISYKTRDELYRLYKLNFNILPKSLTSTIVIDDEEYDMKNSARKRKFMSVYSRVNPAIEKILSSSTYKKLSDEAKAYVLRKTYDTFYNLAKGAIANKGYYPEGKFNLISRMLASSKVGYEQIATFALYLAQINSIEGKDSADRKKKVEKYINSLPLTKENKYTLYLIAGFALPKGQEERMQRYLKSKKLNDEEIEYLLS